MFWLILFIISIIVFGIGIKKDEECMAMGGMFFFICGMIWMLFLFSGITDYSHLKKEHAEIQSLQKRIVDIRQAKYEYKKDGGMIAGSIENFKQSSALTKYLSELAKKEAKYNGYLDKCKSHKEEFLLYFFIDGMFISNKIYQLEKI